MKKSLIIILLAAMPILWGCEDKLNLYPLTTTTEGNFYQNKVQVQQALDDIYRQLGLVYNANQAPDLFGELASDNTYIELTGGADNYSEQITGFFIQADNGAIVTAWNNCYAAIYICNNIIYQLENTKVVLTESELSTMKAQAMLVRSLIYFNLVRIWGAVPYIDKKISPTEAYDYLRVEPAVIYPKLITDLNYCKQVLPASYIGKDIGRVTKYGAAAILAKIYLTIGDKVNAKSELELVINSKLYSLDANNDGTVNTNDYLYIFDPKTKNCKSSVLEAQYLGGTNAMNTNHQSVYMPFYWDFHLPGQTTTFRGGGMNTPTKDLNNEFESNDPRKGTSISPGYTIIGTTTYVTYPFTMKFYDPNWQYEGQNFEIIRYADILLMYAEVTNDAQYLNMVRARVGMPAHGTAGYPSSKYPTLTLAIEHERRIELCFEFHRFFDLKRTNRAIEVMSAKGYKITADKLLFPIPLSAIDVNPKLTQNPGYN